MLRALAIAASSPEYGFCFSLLPRVKEKDEISSLRLLRVDCNSITPLIPTTLFRVELLTAIRTALSVPGCLDTNSSVIVCTLFSHGINVYKLIVFSYSITMSISASTT